MTRVEGDQMNFTFNEVDGDKPISKWIAARVEEWARTRYGVDLQISVNVQTHAAFEPTDEPFAMNSSLEEYSCSRKK